jgi:ferritin-like metal-binding protein YciE
MRLESLEDVLAEQIGDLLSAERQLVEALPKVAQAASSSELRSALDEHLEQTSARAASTRGSAST